MQLHVLGSSGGWPVAGRACSGYLVDDGDTRLWLDAGGGTLQELLRHWSLADVDALVITHLHPDHCSDLALVRNAIAYGGHRNGAPLLVVGPAGWAERFNLTVPDPPATWRAFDAAELADGLRFDAGTLRVHARAVRHETPTFGCRVESPRGVLAYSADSAPCDALVELARDANVFLCEAFRSLPGAGPSDIVSTPEEAGSIATAADARCLLLTHLHPEADPTAAIARARTTYAGPLEVATQGRRVSIESYGR